MKVEDLKQSIIRHADTQAFMESFTIAFTDFKTTLGKRLIDNMLTLNISREIEELSEDIFRRLAPVALIDRYEAYQLLDNEWQGISGDLEILQTEGFDAAKQIEANLVTKKVKGKDTEVQDGWKGHIFPFDLVQKIYLADELSSLAEKENRLVAITAEYDELFDSLSEEIKESKLTNEAKDALVAAEVVKAAKEIMGDIKNGAKYSEEDDETKILKVSVLLTEERILKKERVTDAEALHTLTKRTIENLTDVEVNTLLEFKWITPLVDALHSLSSNSLSKLTQQLTYLAGKYGTTLQDVSNQLKETEQILEGMIGDLTGGEHDMSGLREWQKLLNGSHNVKK
ncbi:MAG: hypothetical protein H7325_03985 [Pedobacter sp.]|nr:hypothetical protein [Pedobacter sp.]